MMLLKVGAAAINQTPLNWKGNLCRAMEVIKEAHNDGVDILCLPELCLTGYCCEDAFFSASTRVQAIASLWEITKLTDECTGMVVAVGFPFEIQKTLYICVALIINGSILGFVPKQNLTSDGVHYEPRWFKPWPAGTKITVPIKTPNPHQRIIDIPVGDIIFDIMGFKVGIEICEDAWVADRPGISLAKRGVDIILNPSASHFAFGKSEIRKAFVIEGSRAFHCSYIYANLLGNEAGRTIYDGDTLIAQNGKLVASGQRFSFKDHVLTTATIDVSRTRAAQLINGSFRPNLEWIKSGVDYRQPLFIVRGSISSNKILDTSLTKFEEFEKAASLGLFDYMRKSQAKGFILSLSGGADSSACACLIRKTIENGVADLGVNTFISRSNFNIDEKELKECIDIKEPGETEKYCLIRKILSKWLTCVYQGTENSSKETLDSATRLTTKLGAEFHWWAVDELITGYIHRVEQAIGRELTWEQDDIPLQNIQARVRSPGIWMIANIKKALLLSTSNRSEAAVGYATMDGDTSGSLAPIAGVDKQFILEWLLSLKDTPIYGEALKDYYALKPTAELRPLEQNQTDEDDLMPYPVLELIEECAIRDKMSPVEVFQSIKWNPTYTDVSNEKVFEWIEKFFRMWSRNQWKRERYAPSFHYDDENLDPRSWCRWPIISGGMAQDVEDLRKTLNCED